MLNILIVENDIIKLKNLINSISGLNLNVNISSIAFNEQEAIDILLMKDIDLVILDFCITISKSSQLINFINNNEIKKFYCSIIVVSNLKFNYEEIPMTKNIYCVIPNLDKQVLLFHIQKLINLKSTIVNSDSLKQNIINILNYLAFTDSHYGTIYLIDLIYEINNNPSLILNLTKNVYPLLANRYKTSINNIKCDIFQSINNAYFNCTQEIYDNFFGYKVIEKPKTIDLIKKVLEYL